MRVEVFKVNEDGEVIDNLLMLEEEVEESTDPFLIPFGWSDKQLYKAIFDFESNEWVEGMSEEDIQEIKNKVTRDNSKPSMEELNSKAIMELTTMIFKGGDV